MTRFSELVQDVTFGETGLLGWCGVSTTLPFVEPRTEEGLVCRGVQSWTTKGGPCMYTSMVWLALSGLAPHADVAASPSWTGDYQQARRQGVAQNKPLAVFL